MLRAEDALTEPTTAKDPTAAVLAFLAVEKQWKALHEGLAILHTFLDANRQHDYEASRRLIELSEHHPPPDTHATAATLAQALRDMNAIRADKAVIARWADYRTAFDQAFAAYREVYQDAYERVRSEAERTLADIEASSVYLEAPANHRDEVVSKFFAPSRVSYYPAISLSTVQSLLDAANHHSLTALDQALVALPVYRTQIEAQLPQLTAPPASQDEKVYEWRPTSLFGQRFATEQDVDQALESIGDEIKTHIRAGFTVVIK
jgi:hypothetical protein